MYSSSYISSLIGQQQAQFSGQLAYAQQLSYPLQAAAAYGGTPPPPPPPPMPPPPMSLMGAMDYAGGGAIYGEQLAARAAGMGRVGLGLAGAAGGMGMAMAGLDPFSVALSAGRAAGGMSLGGIGAGLGAGALAALPMFAAGKMVDVYTGAFTGGMQEQTALNSVLRNNFNFFGGRGTMGRGFDQAQMGQIGMGISSIARNDIFTSVSELNQLVGGGAEAGMMTGVRDVTEFSNKFRKMLDTLKTVQRELGGTLTEALSFARQSKQLGIFSGAGQVNFAQEMRTAEATTGLNRDQLFQLSAQGAQMSRAVGGYGRQGAIGALRTAETLGAAVQSGVVNEELLSEATGGLTGAEALQAAVGNMMQRTARFSRRSMGRFSHFAMSNEAGTGLDPEMLARFQAGDLTVGEVSGRAHRNVNRMGRARAMRQEGVLRGAMLEEGGLSGQIGMMRLMLGDRAMDQGDDVTNLVLRRRFNMSGSEADLMTTLMRNQGNIATQESVDRSLSTRQQALTTDLRENRSMDAFMRHLGHAVQEHTGVAEVREMGRRFVTRLSSIAERAMNDLLGITENQLSGQDLRSIQMISRGRGTAEDIQRIESALAGGAQAGMTGADAFRRGALQTGMSVGEILQSRGVSGVRQMSEHQLQSAVLRAQQARRGVLTDSADLSAFEQLESRGDSVLGDVARARFMASGTMGGSRNYYQFMQGGQNANAMDAFLVSRGMQPGGLEIGAGALLSRGGGGFMGAMGNAAAGYLQGGWSGALGAFRDYYTTDSERAISELASGGATARALDAMGARDMGDIGTAAGMFFRGELTPESVRGRDVTLRRADQLRTAFGNVARNPEALSAIVQSEEGRRILGGIAGAEGPESFIRGMGAFERYAAGLEDPEQQAAAGMLLERMRQEQAGGSLSDELREQLRAATINPEQARQMRTELAAQGAGYSNLAERLRGVGGAGRLGSGFGRIGEMLGRGDVRKAQDEILSQQFAFARLDTGSDEYREIVEAMGQQGETGRAFMQAGSQVRQVMRDLTGRGRRGATQQAETGLGLITGGTFNQMEITAQEGGRRLTAAQVQRLVRRGSAEGASESDRAMAQRIMNQLRGGMSDVTGADELIEQWRGSLQGGIDEGEAESLFRGATGNAALQKRQQEALRDRQRQQDPLSTERNDILKNILAAIKADKTDGGEPRGESS